MHCNQIPIKTIKGQQEIKTRSHRMPIELRRILIMVDGHSTISQLVKKLTGFGEIDKLLAQLEADGFSWRSWKRTASSGHGRIHRQRRRLLSDRPPLLTLSHPHSTWKKPRVLFAISCSGPWDRVPNAASTASTRQLASSNFGSSSMPFTTCCPRCSPGTRPNRLGGNWSPSCSRLTRHCRNRCPSNRSL